MWIAFGLTAGIILGFYDFWTKKSMDRNNVIIIVLWSSLFGMLAWSSVIAIDYKNPIFLASIAKLGLKDQTLIFIKSLAMTLSWLMAYYSVKALPMSFSGAVRASGPLWTLIGGLLLLQEIISLAQFFLICVSIAAYYALSQVGKKEGISVLKSKPVFMMLVATILSAITTVYDKYLIQNIGIPPITIQIVSAFQRFIIAIIIYSIYNKKLKSNITWTFYIPLVGVSWVVAEYIYFLAIMQVESNVTYLSIFRRTSLVIGFILSAIFIGEKNVKQKSLIIFIIILSTILLILEN